MVAIQDTDEKDDDEFLFTKGYTGFQIARPLDPQQQSDFNTKC